MDQFLNLKLTVVKWLGELSITSGLLLAQSPIPPSSVVVSLGKALHLPCALEVVRGSGGADECSLNFVSVLQDSCGYNAGSHQQCVNE